MVGTLRYAASENNKTSGRYRSVPTMSSASIQDDCKDILPKNRPLSVRALENLSGLSTLDILGQCAENVISKLQFSVFQAHFSLFTSNIF
jgi:hypothetical protein